MELTETRLASLIEENMGLVVTLVNRFKPKDPEQLDEFMQLGRIGAWKAIKKYDPSRASLGTFIGNYVRWEILRHLYKEKKNRVTFVDIESSHVVQERLGVVDTTESLWEIMPDNLDDREFNVIQLRLEGNTFIDIGKEIGCPRDTVSNIFRNAVDKINEANGKKKKNLNV